MKLPFKEDFETIEDNFELSKNILKSLSKKFKGDPLLYKEYEKVINSQLEEGIVERVVHENFKSAGNVHYLPHMAVIKQDRSTTKVRVVFDASAALPACTSLNDNLYSGPALTKSLFGVLLRFRSYNFSVVADLEKAFLQIVLDPGDRDYVRFLWFNNFDPGKKFEEQELIVLRVGRVLFGVTSSPFLLEGTLIVHVEKFSDIDPGL